jgi:hypothetical protein
MLAQQLGDFVHIYDKVQCRKRDRGEEGESLGGGVDNQK